MLVIGPPFFSLATLNQLSRQRPMMRPRSRFAAFLTLLGLAFSLGCHRAGDEVQLGAIERVNPDVGTLGVFTFPYYTSTTPLDGDGVVAVYMRQEQGFRPVVYRRAASASAGFGGEQYLTPESMRDTISVVPDLRPGPAANELYVTWQARRQATGDKFVLFRRSTDGGATWEPERRINSQPTSFIPALATDADGGIYAAWIDERKHGFRLYFNRSLDHGHTWLPEDVSLAGNDKYGIVISVDVATDGKGTLIVVWEEDLGQGRQVHSIASNDRGATWTDPMVVDDNTGRFSPSAPRIVFAGGRAVVAWTAAASGKAVRGEVWSDVSADGGKTWGKDVLLSGLDGGIPPRFHLTAVDGTARIVFHAGPTGGPWRIYFDELGADGAWSGGDALPVVSDGDGKFSNPRLAVDRDGALYVAYEEHQKQVRLSRSIDGGKTWTALPEPVYTLADPQSGDAVHYPQVAVANGVAYVTWEVWTSTKNTVKTLADAQNQVAPADLFIRRVTFPRR